MRILNTPPQTLGLIDYFSAAPNRGGRATSQLEIIRMQVDRLPVGLSTLVATSDLQGRMIDAPKEVGGLVGCQVAEHLLQRQLCVNPDRTGILLCGDLYSDATASRRGSTGDVTPVWQSFAERFLWVVGVLGNHDLLDSGSVLPAAFGNAELLDGNLVERSTLRIGGVSGIVGKLTKPNRKDAGLMISLLRHVAAQYPDIILTHESPRAYEGRRGNNAIREWLSDLHRDPAPGMDLPLLISGHIHWHEPLATFGNGAQVLNVDHRVVVLEPAPPNDSSG